jgi:hypothetical protein
MNFNNTGLQLYGELDSSSGMMFVSSDYKSVIAEPKCTTAMNPTFFGYPHEILSFD